MSSDTQQISCHPQPASATDASEETPKLSRSYLRLRQRVETYRGDGFKCVYCGKDLLADSDSLLMATVDHIVPLAAGGSDGHANRATCCSACNRLKDCTVVRSIEEGRRVIALRREEELARFREALGELTPPRSPEFVALSATVERLDSRTLAGQALQLTLLARQQAMEIGKLACELMQRAAAVNGDGSESIAEGSKPRGPLWRLLRRLVG
jgi:hypothetical protein